ncbi:MAG: hypothetical protein AABX65_04080 [Nanoarchaeota archaeon]
MKIGVDLDDVLADTWNETRKFLNRRFGKNLTNKDFNDFGLAKTYGVSNDEVRKAFADAFNNGLYLNAKLIKGAVSGIGRLEDGNELYIITSRPRYIEGDTYSWVEKNFPSKFKEVRFSSHTTDLKEDTEKETKAEICKELGVLLMIDDNLDNLEECARAGVKGIVLDLDGNYNWNHREREPDGVERAFSWKEIVKIAQS